MKIIDLLNKIANGEEVPKKIKYKNIEYKYEDVGYYNKQRGYLFDGYYTEGILDDEVEILEEEKKIPEKFKVHSLGDKDKNGNFVSSPFPTNEEFMNKINDIIDYLDYLKSKGEKEDEI